MANDAMSARMQPQQTGMRRRPWWRRPLLRVLTVVGPPVVSMALRALQLTLRTEFVNANELFARWARGERVIIAFWHDRLLMMPIAASGVRICTMVSQHRDGEIATRALARWGIDTVRGSATRGGIGGFLRLVGAYRGGSSLAVVPDGPRGPRYAAKPGVIHLAKATGGVIFPVTYAANRAAHLRSWDRLVVPLPFARVTVEVGEPLRVPAGAGEEELETQRQLLERRLSDLTRVAEARLAP